MRYAVQVVTVALLYYAAARVGLLMAFQQTNASPVWPPSGIALAALVFFGARVWPGVTIGAFAANAVVFAANHAARLPTILLASAIIALGNTVEAAAGRYLLARLVNASSPLDRAASAFRFVATAAAVCVLSATVGPTLLCSLRMVSWEFYPTVWFTWWLGDAAAILVLTPLLPGWHSHPNPLDSPRRAAEAAGVFGTLMLAVWVIFGGRFAVASQHYPVAYMLIPLVVWLAFRFGSHGVVAANLVISVAAILGTISGYGPFVRDTLNASLLFLQLYVCSAAITGLVLAGVLSERRATRAALQQAYDALDRRVAERTAELGTAYASRMAARSASAPTTGRGPNSALSCHEVRHERATTHRHRRRRGFHAELPV
jgi:integral membrane sensor domain MASE1